MLEKELHPLAEKWSKVKLEHTSTYGIRWHKPQITFECINFHQIVKTIHEWVLVDFSRGQIYYPCGLRHPERCPGREGGLAPVHQGQQGRGPRRDHQARGDAVVRVRQTGPWPTQASQRGLLWQPVHPFQASGGLVWGALHSGLQT